MKKIVFSIALAGISLSINAQCGSVGAAMRALKQDKYDEAKTLFDKAGVEILEAEAKEDPVDKKCYAKYYYGSGSNLLQKYHSDMTIDLVLKVDLLNKSEAFFTKFFDLNYEDDEIRTKAITDLEAVANRQKEVAYDFFQAGDYEKAFELFEKCINNKSKLGEGYLDLHAYKSASITASRLDEHEKALLYNEFLIKNPDKKVGPEVNSQEKNLSRKAELLGNLGKTEEALKVLDSAKTVFPGNVNIEIQQLRMYMAAQNNEGALVVLESLTQKITDRDDLFSIMGQLYGEKGEGEKSYEAYKRAYGINQQNTNALYGMGAYYINKSNENVQNLNKPETSQAEKDTIIAERKNNFNKAIHYFELLLKIDPKDKSTLKALKLIYTEKEDTAKVAEIEQKLLAE